MATKREVMSILLSILLMAIMLNFSQEDSTQEKLIFSLVASFIVIISAVFSKKIVSSILDVKIENKIWEFKRYWWTRSSELKRAIPIGILLPLLLSLLSYGSIKFFTFLQFNSEALPSKVVKKYGSRRFPNMMDWDDALISFYSMIGVLIISVISSLITYNFFNFNDLSKLAFYYALFNMITFGQLDGLKVFMGSRPLYIFSLVILIISGLIVLL